LFLFILILSGLTACQLPFQAQETSTITSEVLTDTSTPLPAREAILITTRHQTPSGIERVVVFLNGRQQAIYEPAFAQSSYTVEHPWTPPQAGTYTWLIRSYSKNDLYRPQDLEFSLNVTDSLQPASVLPPEITPTPTTDFGPPTACTYRAELVSDVTLPDNTTVEPGQALNKTWRIRNAGTCPWGAGYSLRPAENNPLGGQPVAVPPAGFGDTVDLSVALTAPLDSGTYQSNWRLVAPDGRAFGDIFFAKVVVPGCEARGPQIENFAALPPTVRPNEAVTLNWAVTQADSVTLSPGGAVALSGQQTVRPQESTNYTLTAIGNGCTATQQVSVTVSQSLPDNQCTGLIINSFSAVPGTISPGQTSTLSWVVTGAEAVRLIPGGSQNNAGGSITVSPSQTQVYQLEARTSTCVRTAQVTVAVGGIINLPTAPSNLAVVEARATSVDLSWVDQSQNESNFRLADVANGKTWATFPANQTTGSVTGLSCATAYRFQLYAQNEQGSSLGSNILTVNTAACQ
jgi:hypothetical protein